MKATRTKWLAIGAIAFALIIVGWLVFGHSREPRYKGQPLSYWFREYYYANTSQPYHDDYEDEAADALKAIGTNALPYILKQAFDTNADSEVRKQLNELFKEFPEGWHLPRFVSGKEIPGLVPGLVRLINPPAGEILSLLPAKLNQNTADERIEAIEILAAATNGMEISVPYFTKALHDTNANIQIIALYALEKTGSNATPAIADLVMLVQTNKPSAASCQVAADVLANLGADATVAAPLLRGIFDNETNWARRCMFATDLYRIDGRQSGAFEFITNGLTNWTEPRKILFAAFCLRRIGPAATAAIPSLIKALDTTDVDAWRSVMISLRALGVPNAEITNQLKHTLGAKDDDLRFAAAAEMLKIDPYDQEAQHALVDMIKRHSEQEPEAIGALGRAGPAAKDTAAVIVEAFDGTNIDSWIAAPEALVKIGVAPEVFLARLDDKLTSGTLGIQNDFNTASLASEVLKFDPESRSAQTILVGLSKSHGNAKVFALRGLSKARPSIPEVLPTLKLGLKSDDARVRKAAAEALKEIELTNNTPR